MIITTQQDAYLTSFWGRNIWWAICHIGSLYQQVSYFYSFSPSSGYLVWRVAKQQLKISGFLRDKTCVLEDMIKWTPPFYTIQEEVRKSLRTHRNTQINYSLSYNNYQIKGGTRWGSWLRHCATSQKVAGSIPDGVIGIFHWHNPSGLNMALELTQSLTEMSTRNISWG